MHSWIISQNGKLELQSKLVIYMADMNLHQDYNLVKLAIYIYQSTCQRIAEVRG
jgi:hypothetical protein